MAGRVSTDRQAGLASAASSATSAAPSYYDVPLLKAPVWKWEIAHYFFWGGLSAGAYILARLAERFGGGRYRELTQAGTAVSFIAALPCAPLLIHDLGDPKRFHHMLRLWRPSTPMNLGTWTLTAYSGMATAAVVREYLRSRPVREHGELAHLTGATLLALNDAAGVPLALMVAGYTGVLLSCTANPMWVKNPWLGPLFASSAIATGAEAISLALDIAEPGGVGARQRRESAQASLETINTVAHLAEGITLAGYLCKAGHLARPLLRGGQRHHLAFSVGGLVAAEVIKRLPLSSRAKTVGRMLASGLGLAAGFSLRWGIVYGGREAANDPALARLATSRQDAPRLEPSTRSTNYEPPGT